MKYKFRAEGVRDVYEFIRASKIVPENFKITPQSIEGGVIPDVEVSFKSDMSLEDLRNIAEDIEDCHVIVQSLNAKKLYTGERYFNS